MTSRYKNLLLRTSSAFIGRGGSAERLSAAAMPTLYSRLTTVQLSISDLADATTARPVTHQSKEATDNVQDATEALIKGSRDATLTEDLLYTDDEQSRIRFLGKYQDMPFFMVHAGKDYFNLDDNGRRTRRPARLPSVKDSEESAVDLSSFTRDTGTNDLENSSESQFEKTGLRLRFLRHRNTFNQFAGVSALKNPYGQLQTKASLSLEPHALCLTVFLTNASFLRKYDRKLEKTTVNDVKVDVYFNGELCSSTYCPERYRAAAKTMTELIIRSSGRRIGRLIEKPWVITWPGQNLDGTLSKEKGSRSNRVYPGAMERWAALSKALELEAEKSGRDTNGELSVGGEYLASLARLQMPSDVEEIQKEGGPKFGVIDVVVISGRGQKDEVNSPQLTEPTALRVKRYESDVSKPRREVSSTSLSKEKRRGHADAEIAAQAVYIGTSGPRNGTKPTLTSRSTTRSDVAVGPRSDTPYRDPAKPALLIPHSPNGSYDDMEGPSPKSAKATQINRRASLPIRQSQPLRDQHRDADGHSRSIPAQQNADANPVSRVRGRSTLLHELAALAADGKAASLVAGEATLPTRLRKETPKPQASIELPVRPSRRTMSPGSRLPGRDRLSQKARIGARNGMGAFARPHNSNSPDNPQKYVPQKRYKGPEPSPPPEQPPPKRARIQYTTVVDDKRTLAEEMAAIEEEAQKELETALAGGSYQPLRSTRSRYASTAASPPTTSPVPESLTAMISNSPNLETPNKVKLKLSAPAPPTATKIYPYSSSPPPQSILPTRSAPLKRSRAFSISPAPDPAPADIHTPAQGNPQTTTSPPPTSSPPGPDNPSPSNPPSNLTKPHGDPKPRSRRRRRNRHDTFDANFTVPELSRDCVITYAGPGVMRQVKGERGGWFEEEGVVMGVRFLVGWGL